MSDDNMSIHDVARLLLLGMGSLQATVQELATSHAATSQQNAESQTTTAQALALLSSQSASNNVPPLNPVPANPPAPRTSIKWADPAKFSGKAIHVPSFVASIRDRIAYAPSTFPDERSKCVYFGSWLEAGVPQAWYYGIRSSNISILEDFDDFVLAFEQHFGDPDIARTNQKKLESLKQTGPCADYAARFRELVAVVPLTMWTAIELFWSGLNDEVRKGLVYSGGRGDNLDNLIIRAITIDRDLYEVRKSSSKDYPRRNDNTSHSHSSSYTPKSNSASTPSTTTPSSSSGPAPMEIDVVKNGHLTMTERARRIAEKLCLYCGEKHDVNNCPKKAAKAAKSGSSDQGKAKPQA